MTNLLLHVFMETNLLNYSSQGVSKLPGLGYTDMQEFCMYACTDFLTILLALLTGNVPHLLLVDVTVAVG